MTLTDEQLSQIVFAALLPAARMAADEEVDLRELKRLAELACYRELKRRRLTMKEICQRISVSMGKVAGLSKRLKAHFSQPAAEFELPRRIIAQLQAGPETETRLARTLHDHTLEEVRDALSGLLEKGLIAEVQGRTTRYRLVQSAYRQIRTPWRARVDALADLMSSVSDAIRARFHAEDERAFARTLTFRVKESDVPRLRQLYDETIFPMLAQMDGDAEGEPSADVVPLKLSILWAPDSLAGVEMKR